MKLPHDLISGTYTKPNCYLCETDKTKICKLDPIGLKGTFKLNSYSEINFDIASIYNDILNGYTVTNPFYDKVEALRLVYLEGFGYFEIQGPELTSDGIEEKKSITAYSLEYTLSQKYLTDFYVNTGEVNSLEVLNATDPNSIVPITLYNPNNKNLSLLHLILEKTYGWKIGHVDLSLQTLSRQFEIDRESVYDFIMNEICEKFNCYVIFDTVNNTINLYAESLTSRFIGDGTTNTFTISPPFSKIGTVSVDGYKTTRWQYNSSNGRLVLEDTPYSGAHIEVVDGALTEWETDVFVSFDNLAQEVNVEYDADSIKTVLSVTYGDNCDIREANLGLPYITDISYYYTEDWMGKDLYDAYGNYLIKTNQYQSQYTDNSQKMLDIAGYIDFEENRLSLGYSIAQSVNAETVGTYYVRGGSSPDYYYTEVSLPAEYNVNTTYYSINTANLAEEKVSNLYAVLKKYFKNEDDWNTELDKLSDDFKFMGTDAISNLSITLASVAPDRTESSDAETAINNFLATMWNEIGRTPLKQLYYESYKKVQITNIEAGWSKKDNANYGYYYPVVLMLNSIESAIAKRDKTISEYEKQYNTIAQNNANISNELLMSNNFTEGQLIRLSAFLREDELQLDDIVETDQDSIADTFKIKQDAMESGRIELSKLSQPQLKFSMSMANIYALPEFEPIINQFQLGNVIKVEIRKGYVKQSRLMQVELNFDDFSDFSCEFGDLTSLRSQSDIHADLLKNAISAGKTVASSANYWTKGSDQATSIDLRLKEGLLNSIEALKAMDGTQSASMDKYGIHLAKIDPITGVKDPKQCWLVNNQIVFTDDAFKSSKSVLGEFTVDGQTFYGLLAEAVLSGHIEGSSIRGGTIKIGERPDGSYNFEVDENGYITMIGGKTTDKNGNEVNLDDYNTTVELTSSGTVVNKNNQSITLTCKIYNYDTDVTNDYSTSSFRWIRSTGDTTADEVWNNAHMANSEITITADDVSDVTFFECQVQLSTVKSSNRISITTSNSDVNVFTSKPNKTLIDGYCYHKSDIWIVNNDYQPTGYAINTILVCVMDNTTYSDNDWVESVKYSKTFTDLSARQDIIEEHVKIDEEGLHLIGPSEQGISFESLLQSGQLTFRSIQSGDKKKDVVWIGTNTTQARELTAYKYVNVQADPEDSSVLPYIQLGDFKLQVEANGSLSIV